MLLSRLLKPKQVCRILGKLKTNTTRSLICNSLISKSTPKYSFTEYDFIKENMDNDNDVEVQEMVQAITAKEIKKKYTRKLLKIDLNTLSDRRINELTL